jgi:hypothetical protein
MQANTDSDEPDDDPFFELYTCDEITLIEEILTDPLNQSIRTEFCLKDFDQKSNEYYRKRKVQKKDHKEDPQAVKER